MPIEYRYDTEQRIIFARGLGEVSLQNLLDYGHEVASLDADLTGAVEYVDLSEATDIALTFTTVQQMVKVYAKWSRRGVLGTVIFAPTDLSFGMARMMSVVVASALGVEDAGPHVSRDPISPEDLRRFVQPPDPGVSEG